MTKRIEKTIEIDAVPEAVWKVLTDDKLAAAWTSQFMPGSTVEGDWRVGGTVYYKDAQCTGVRCRISAFDAPRHLRVDVEGEINENVEDTSKDGEWLGCYDDYTIEEHDGQTRLVLDTVCPDVYYDGFLEMWDDCLATIQELAEDL